MRSAPQLVFAAVAAALLMACGGSGDDDTDVSADSVTSEAAGSESSGSGEFVEAGPFDAVSATAQAAGIGPVSIRGQCSAAGGAYVFDSSAADNDGARLRLLVFAATNTVESAFFSPTDDGTQFTFTEIDTVEVTADRYVVDGQGSDGQGNDGPMNFTILCRG